MFHSVGNRGQVLRQAGTDRDAPGRDHEASRLRLRGFFRSIRQEAAPQRIVQADWSDSIPAMTFFSLTSSWSDSG